MSIVIFTNSSIQVAGTSATGFLYYRPFTISFFYLIVFFISLSCYGPLNTNPVYLMGFATSHSTIGPLLLTLPASWVFLLALSDNGFFYSKALYYWSFLLSRLYYLFFLLLRLCYWPSFPALPPTYFFFLAYEGVVTWKRKGDKGGTFLLQGPAPGPYYRLFLAICVLLPTLSTIWPLHPVCSSIWALLSAFSAA